MSKNKRSRVVVVSAPTRVVEPGNPRRRRRRATTSAQRLLPINNTVIPGGVSNSIARVLSSGDVLARHRRRATYSRRPDMSARDKAMKAYMNALTDPFDCPPVRLGWGCFAPTSLMTAFVRFPVPLFANSTCFAVCGTPYFAGSSSAINTNSFIKGYTSDASTVTLNGATGLNRSATGAFNVTTLNAMINRARVVAGGLRVSVRYPATQLRGRVFAGLIPRDFIQTFEGLNFAQLANLFPFKECYASSEGELICEVQYRPLDPLSFDLSADLVLTGGNGSTPMLVVVGDGWVPNSFALSAIQVFHYESQGGLDQSGQDTNDSLASANVGMDQIANVVASEYPVLPSLSTIEMIDHGIHNAYNSSQRTGMSYNALGALVSASHIADMGSSSSSSSTPPTLIRQDTLGADDLSTSVYLPRSLVGNIRRALADS